MSSLFGFDQSNRLVHVSEVARGLACHCHCVVCNEFLVAKQGKVREHHFAHASGREPCEASHESLLHRYVKQLIAESSGLTVPAHPELVTVLGLTASEQPAAWLSLAEAEVEKAVLGIRPDVLATTPEGVSVAIEVAYSSFCDLLKVAQFEAMGLPALEIDLHDFQPDGFGPADVRSAVLDEISRKRWLWPIVREDSGESPVPDGPEMPEIQQRCPEEIVDISGRWISIKTLRSGDIALKVIRYDPALVSLIRVIARGNSGWYWVKGRSWIVPKRHADQASQQLRDLSGTIEIIAVAAGVLPSAAEGASPQANR